MTGWSLVSAIVAALALAAVIAACSGDDSDDSPQPKPPAADAPPDSGGATPPSADQLPPEFMKCMADQGFPIESPDQIHSAPRQILQACFGALHGGGDGP